MSGEGGEESVSEIEKIDRIEKIGKIEGLGLEEFGKFANLHIRKSANETAKITAGSELIGLREIGGVNGKSGDERMKNLRITIDELRFKCPLNSQ